MNLTNFLKFKLKYFLFFIISLWIIGIFWELISSYFNSAILLLPFMKYNYSLVCHTQTDKLFQIGHYHTLVCSRCFGIYLGIFISSFFSLFNLKLIINAKIFVLSSIPMIIDILLYTFNVYEYSQLIALLTGLLFGIIGYFFIIDSIYLVFTKKEVVKT